TEIGQRVAFPAGRDEFLAIMLSDDHDPPTRTSGSRLNDEVGPVAGKFEKPPHVAVALDQGICLGNGNARGMTDPLRHVFFIDPRVESAAVQRQDVLPIAAIDADDAPAFQLARPGPESPWKRSRHAATPGDSPAD